MTSMSQTTTSVNQKETPDPTLGTIMSMLRGDGKKESWADAEDDEEPLPPVLQNLSKPTSIYGNLAKTGLLRNSVTSSRATFCAWDKNNTAAKKIFSSSSSNSSYLPSPSVQTVQKIVDKKRTENKSAPSDKNKSRKVRQPTLYQSTNPNPRIFTTFESNRNSYNADFGGDEMNMHVPEDKKTEVLNILLGGDSHQDPEVNNEIPTGNHFVNYTRVNIDQIVHEVPRNGSVQRLLHDKVVQQNNPYISSEIRLTDSCGKLRLYHYVYCDRDSDDSLKNCRGVVRDEEKIVCKTFGYTEEYLVSERSLIESKLHSFPQCKFYDGEEGANLRLYFYGGKWYLSTHRKFNANSSRWGSSKSKSFGEMFLDGLEWQVSNSDLGEKVKYESRDSLFDAYTATLDQNKTYCFLVRNTPENRIVCEGSEHPQIFFVGSFERSTHFLIEGNDSGVPMPEQHQFGNLDELLDYVENLDYKKKTSIIVYMPNQQQFKIINSRYNKYFKVRGNEPSIRFRYLQIRMDRDMVALLYNLYPEEIQNFENYENSLDKVSKVIEAAYVKRYIPPRDGRPKEFVSLPQPQFLIMQACHNWHVSDRTSNKVSIDKIHEVIDNQSAESLNKLIKSFHSEE